MDARAHIYLPLSAFPSQLTDRSERILLIMQPISLQSSLCSSAKNTCLLPEYQEYGRKADYASCVRIQRDDKVTKNHFLFLSAYQPQQSKLYRPTPGLCFGERGQISISLVSE